MNKIILFIFGLIFFIIICKKFNYINEKFYFNKKTNLLVMVDSKTASEEIINVKTFHKYNSLDKKLRKILVRTVLVIILICVLGTLVLSLPFVQTSFAKYATNTINKDFGVNINIDKLRVSLISWDTNLEGVFIEDYKKDTLFYVDRLTTSVLSIRNLVNGWPRNS